MNKTRLICLSGFFAALVFVFTAYLHIPSYNGYVHVGDAFIFLAACLMPLPYNTIVGALGALLADCLTGYAIWAPASIIIKSLTAMFFSQKAKKIISLRNIIALVPAWILCIGGYYIYDALIICDFKAALAGLPGNVMQCAFSTVLFIILGAAFDKFDLKTKFINGGNR